jgi:t-SNARE complex subunit (syntaxin)
MRPEYERRDNSIHSNDTWREAGVISQEWAIEARQAALKRKRRNFWLAMVLLLIFIIAVVMFILFVTGNLIGEE